MQGVNNMTKTKKPAKTAAKKTAKVQKIKAITKKDGTMDADVIVESKASNAKNTETHVVRSAGGEILSFPTAQWQGAMRSLCAVGESFAAAKAHLETLKKVPAKMASGVTGRDAPHASKAIADARAKEKPAKPVTVKKAPPKTAKSDDARSIVITDKGKAQIAKKADNGSTRNLNALVKAGSVAKALAAGLKMGDVNYAAKVGTIELK
jgi:hypothetical protein